MSERIIVQIGSVDPIPAIGDKFEESIGILFEICPCNCRKGSLGPMGGASCGPHFIDKKGIIDVGVYWKKWKGWLVNGTLVRNELAETARQSISNLKISNTHPQATHCASCGNQLKDPGMGPTYKHCPKCEP